MILTMMIMMIMMIIYNGYVDDNDDNECRDGGDDDDTPPKNASQASFFDLYLISHFVTFSERILNTVAGQASKKTLPKMAKAKEFQVP